MKKQNQPNQNCTHLTDNELQDISGGSEPRSINSGRLDFECMDVCNFLKTEPDCLAGTEGKTCEWSAKKSRCSAWSGGSTGPHKVYH